jgi:DNA-binding transcriptional ArsR family regulator
MTKKGGQGDDASKRAASLGHELRQGIIQATIRGPVSAAEIAEKVGLPADKVRYQLRQLAEVGIVDVVERKARRGVVEHFHLVNDSRTVLEDDDLGDLPAGVRDRFYTQIFKLVVGAASRSFRAGVLGRREESFVLNVPLRLDAEGWTELGPIYRKTLSDVERVKAKSEARLKTRGEEPILATAALFLFELPPDEEA